MHSIRQGRTPRGYVDDKMARMSPAPEGSAGAAPLAAANDYDGFAEAYSTETETNLLNGYYARPAPRSPAGRSTR